MGRRNVRSINVGKFNTVKDEINQLYVGILGISELKWPEIGYFQSKDHPVYHLEHEKQRRNNVAFISRKNITKTVLTTEATQIGILQILQKSKRPDAEAGFKKG